MEKFSWLPVEEDGRLHDPVLRENFIERVLLCMSSITFTRRNYQEESY